MSCCRQEIKYKSVRIHTPCLLFGHSIFTHQEFTRKTITGNRLYLSYSNKMLVTIGLLFLSHLAAVSLADCCDAHFDFTDGKWICADGTVATPCCGKGPCNAFCCDCGMFHPDLFDTVLETES